MIVGEAEVIFAEVAKQGLWAVLYVTLFLYTLRESKRREERLRDDYVQLQNDNRDRENKLTSFLTDITKEFERLATGFERLTVDVDEIKDEIKIRKEVERINREEAKERLMKNDDKFN